MYIPKIVVKKIIQMFVLVIYKLYVLEVFIYLIKKVSRCLITWKKFIMALVLFVKISQKMLT